MICNCDFPITLKSQSITLSGTTLTISVSGVNLASIQNLQKINLILCQTIPSGAGTAQVVLNDGTTTLNILVRTGNYLRADQIKCRKCYPLIYGNDTAHLSLLCLVPQTSYVASSTSATSLSEVSVAKLTKTSKSSEE